MEGVWVVSAVGEQAKQHLGRQEGRGAVIAVGEQTTHKLERQAGSALGEQAT
jgi:hypothetical protein